MPKKYELHHVDDDDHCHSCIGLGYLLLGPLKALANPFNMNTIDPMDPVLTNQTIVIETYSGAPLHNIHISN
jgi:hypothetical protein